MTEGTWAEKRRLDSIAELASALSDLMINCRFLAQQLMLESVTLQGEPSDLTHSAQSLIEIVDDSKHWVIQFNQLVDSIASILPNLNSVALLPNTLQEEALTSLTERRRELQRLVQRLPKLGWGERTVLTADDGNDIEFMLRTSLDLAMKCVDRLISDIKHPH
ncbi:MAG: hypothetical protein HWE20_16625 [Gammaproteobacteria bacterium]|nr:hypothetical protein [Gammaproteobacteria bacterium]